MAVSGGSNNSNGGKVLSSTDPTGGPGSWHFENLVAFRPTQNEERTPAAVKRTLLGLLRLDLALRLVGSNGRIFTATDPFSAPAKSTGSKGRKAPRRPRTIIVFAEHFWKVASTRRRHIRARFRFYSPTRTRDSNASATAAPTPLPLTTALWRNPRPACPTRARHRPDRAARPGGDQTLPRYFTIVKLSDFGAERIPTESVAVIASV